MSDSQKQPAPVPNDRPPVWEAVIADMHARDKLGRERYGTPLQPHNGRDPARDAYEEALDQAVYLKQLIMEREDEIVFQPGDRAHAVILSQIGHAGDIAWIWSETPCVVAARLSDAYVIAPRYGTELINIDLRLLFADQEQAKAKASSLNKKMRMLLQ